MAVERQMRRVDRQVVAKERAVLLVTHARDRLGTTPEKTMVHDQERGPGARRFGDGRTRRINSNRHPFDHAAV
jgi:hypothetical protein